MKTQGVSIKTFLVFFIPYTILTTFKLAVRKYIHFYNHQRFQKKFNNLSPYKYKNRVA
ncbi:hypothetical protein CN425_13635 [Bacillus cereus]|uniref:Integrase catalytic domain-containing protein n=1 Tax=Bacillus cereus TaxID=1396 RepID=A0A2A8PVJ5_BACCE|nr:hypothetical protein CN425_13635 [Bacillus cereus]